MTVQVGQPATAQDIIKSTALYAADAGGTDAYAISLPTAPSAYADGLTVRFKANTANTGASTLNVNTLGAIAIKRPDGTDTQTGDIVANQIVEVCYRNSAFHMISPIVADRQQVMGALQAGMAKLFFNTQLLLNAYIATPKGTEGWELSADHAEIQILRKGLQCVMEGSGTQRTIKLSGYFEPLGAGTNLEYNGSGKIILDFNAKLIAGSGIFSMGFFSNPEQAWDANGTGVGFYMDNGVIYALTKKADPSGSDEKTDVSSGITETNWNNYRIELDIGVDVKFYINGTLVKTTTSGAASFPITSAVNIGFGFEGSAGTGTDFTFTAPFLSIEMNP